MSHPASMSGWLNLWSLIADLQSHLEFELGFEAYEVAWERGENADWKASSAMLSQALSLEQIQMVM